ncbi:hypothetical protein KZ813_07815 [Sphingomonas sp. RHCKR7]|uniref:hypothetical protein n=1 Tax=Sphingomonas folli TaxID=2862497 RepID=UPI001CA5526E|nr:hypothetical protein [Sphingomonas folli]MBW6526740.1 hypothetical protein [Sphingomonas folli]
MSMQVVTVLLLTGSGLHCAAADELAVPIATMLALSASDHRRIRTEASFLILI